MKQKRATSFIDKFLYNYYGPTARSRYAGQFTVIASTELRTK